MEDEDVHVSPSPSTGVLTPSSKAAAPEAEFKSHSLQSLLDTLPSRISFSSVQMTLTQLSDAAESSRSILRRDLFDARFQMLLSGDDEDSDDEQAAESSEAPYDAHIDQHSDLTPGVYEGGLKTWECALDLVDVLNTMLLSHNGLTLQDKHVLELGCGTAIPTLFLLEKLLETETPHKNVTLHLADYNVDVLSLVTLPNLILAWWNSPAATSFRSGSGAQISANERDELRRRGQDHFDTDESTSNNIHTPQATGELSLTPELLSSFTHSLHERGIYLRFYSGAWSKFPTSLTPAGAPIDVVLTSETIYSLKSLPALVDLLHRYTSRASNTGATPVCLIAAKVIYFGVGGGVELFKQHAAAKAARITTVKSITHGVGRTILSVEF